MKAAFSSLLAVASTASAHYTFPALIAGSKTTGAWEYVRKTTNYQSNGPVTDVTSDQIRCYELSPGTGAQTVSEIPHEEHFRSYALKGSKYVPPNIGTSANVSTYTVNAGDTVGFTAVTSISHPGPLQFYLAKVPSGQTAATFDGAGAVWFKVYSQGATFSSGQMTFASSGKTQVTFPLPKSLPSGEYLLRVEHIALHSAGSKGGAQFYISCGQIKVANGGNGTPGPMISLPGGYSSSDPGILINIYYPVPTSYTPPGPAVWTG